MTLLNRSHLRFAVWLLAQRSQRRHLARWLASLQRDYLLRRALPWIVFDAIDYLQTLDLRGKRVFEFGSGGSTLFWLRRGASCVSVEHDPEWYERLRATLPSDAPVDYRFVPPDPHPLPNPSPDPSDPAQYVSADYAEHPADYRRYASQIDEFADSAFDVVLIDGRARPSCLKHSLSKVAVGGIIILDNSDRAYYTDRTRSLLRHFKQRRFVGAIPLNNFVSETSIFLREA